MAPSPKYTTGISAGFETLGPALGRQAGCVTSISPTHLQQQRSLQQEQVRSRQQAADLQSQLQLLVLRRLIFPPVGFDPICEISQLLSDIGPVE